MKIYIETYGCAANQSDSDTMKSLLSEKHEFVDSVKKAELIILNSCGVKGSTQNKIMARLEKFKDKKVLVAGCLTKIATKLLQEKFPEYSLIGPDQITDIVEIISKIENKKRVIELKTKSYKLPLLKEPKKVQPITICKGCLGNCAYCATKLAKGKLQSFPISCVKKMVENAVSKGTEKILLTAQDTGAYGLDIETSLPELLREILSIEGNFKIRIGMMNPNYALEYANELVKIFQNQKMIKFLHIPVQSGSNKVLKDMHRKYSVEDFKKVVDVFRKKIPDIKIGTDIICGLPNETKEDLKKTLELVKQTKPDMLNISKFYPRPGTEAKKMKLLPTETVKQRSRKLSNLFKELRKA